MQTFEVVESYLHQAAKAVVVDWLRAVAAEGGGREWFTLDPVSCRPNRGGPEFGIWPEFPITACGLGADYLWDEIEEWAGKPPPTPDEVIASGMKLAAVVDVAVFHKGRLGCAVEIVHKHPTPQWKRDLLDKYSIGLVEVCATGVMHHTKRPQRLPLFNGRRR